MKSSTSNFKSLRGRLFRLNRPAIRQLQVLDGDNYSRDVGILWAAYQAKSFPHLGEVSQEEFANYVDELAQAHSVVWVVEDTNKAFKSGFGPVAIVTVDQQELTAVPIGKPFSWATLQNKLRCAVMVLQKLRRSSNVGVALVRVPESDKRFARALEKYGVLYWVGRTAKNEHLFQMRGRGSE